MALASAFGGVVMLGLGVVVWRDGRKNLQDGAWIEVEPEARTLIGLTLNQGDRSLYRIVNRHPTKPWRIVGGQAFCEPDGCVGFDAGALPITIFPGGSADLAVTYTPTKAGPFTHTFPIYTDAPGQFEIHLTLSGDVPGAPAPLAKLERP